MMKLLLQSIAILFIAWYPINITAYPDGLVTAACITMEPHHHGLSAQTIASPYMISAAKNTYSAGEKITVTLNSTSGSLPFKGCLIQVRSGSDTTPLGYFEVINNLTQTLTCSTPASAVSHTSSVNKTSIQVTWVAPNSTKGDIEIRATVVKEFTIFWTGVISEKLSFAGQATTISSSSTTPTTTNSSTTPTTTTSMGTTIKTTWNYLMLLLFCAGAICFLKQ